MIEDIANLSLDVQWLLDQRIVVLLVLVFFIVTWWRTRSSLAAAAALVTGLLVWALVLSREDLRDSINEDISDPGSTVSDASEVAP